MLRKVGKVPRCGYNHLCLARYRVVLRSAAYPCHGNIVKICFKHIKNAENKLVCVAALLVYLNARMSAL